MLFIIFDQRLKILNTGNVHIQSPVYLSAVVLLLDSIQYIYMNKQE